MIQLTKGQPAPWSGILEKEIVFRDQENCKSEQASLELQLSDCKASLDSSSMTGTVLSYFVVFGLGIATAMLVRH